MQRVLQDEDGRQRHDRALLEDLAARAVIARRDIESTPGEAERFAHRQIMNQNRRMPLDYEGILRYRAIEPGLFGLLPNDDECRAAIGRGEGRKTLGLKKTGG